MGNSEVDFICFSLAYFSHFNFNIFFLTMNGLTLRFILVTLILLKKINVLIINKSEIKGVNLFFHVLLFIIFED